MEEHLHLEDNEQLRELRAQERQVEEQQERDRLERIAMLGNEILLTTRFRSNVRPAEVSSKARCYGCINAFRNFKKTKCYSALRSCADFLTPLENDIKQIQAQYDRSISAFFIFIQHEIFSSMVEAAIYTYFIVDQAVAQLTTEEAELCYAGETYRKLPCVFFYSRIDQAKLDVYTISLYTALFCTFYLRLRGFIRAREANHRINLIPRTEARFSSRFFNSLEWNLTNEVERDNFQSKSYQQFIDELGIVRRYEQIKKRSRTERRLTYCRRCVLILINLTFLTFFAALVIYVSVNEDDVVHFIQDLEWVPDAVQRYAELAPSLVITLSLSVIPPVVQISTDLEGWDFDDEKIVNQIARIFIVSMAQYTVYILIQFTLLLDISWLRGDQRARRERKFQCPEDELTINFVQTYNTMCVVKIVSILGRWLLFGLILPCLGFDESTTKRAFNVSQEVVWFLAFQLVLQVTVQFFPMSVYIQPILQYILFKMYKFQLDTISKKPTVRAPDESTAVTINLLSVVTYGLYILQIIVVSIVSFKRNYYQDEHLHICGPLAEGETLQTNLQNFFATHRGAVVRALDYVINSWTTLLVLLVLTVVAMQFLRTEQRLLRDKFLEDIEEFQGRIQIMKKQVRRQENKIEMLQRASRI